MRLKTIITILLISSTLFSYGQDLVAMFKDKAYWGFMDIKGEVLIKPKYTYCRNFYSGMAKVGKTDFINIKGEKLKAEVKFLDASQFSDGMLAVKIVNKWGFINNSGKLIIDAKYKSVTDFYEGYSIGEMKDKVVILDKNGVEIDIVVNKKIESFNHFSEGLAPIEIKGRFGFVNTKGVIVVEPTFLSVGFFSEGLAWARVEGGLISFINKYGETIIPPIYYAASEFEGGITRVKTKQGWGYINIKGENLPIDKNIDVFKNTTESSALVHMNGLWGFINAEGGWLIEPKFEGATPFNNGYARIEKDNKWGVINKKGEWVLEPVYDNIKSFYLVE